MAAMAEPRSFTSRDTWPPQRRLRGRLLGPAQLAIGGALAAGALAGYLSQRHTSDAIIACLVVVGIVALATLGERAFPWAVILIAVAPWYPFVSEAAEPPIVKQKVLTAVIAGAPLVPWLWSLASPGRRTQPSRWALLMGVLFAGLTLFIYETLHSVSALIESKIVGFIVAGVAFLCARRFAGRRGWLAAAFGGLVLLLAFGAYAYAKAPSNRVGYFAGYPITYGGLVVGLLPMGLLFAYQRSRLLAAAVAAAAAILLIFSESRSSWVAVVGLILIVVVIEGRAGNYRALAALGSVVVVLFAVIAGTGSLSRIVEKKLSSNIAQSQSVTHREWSYSYALKTIGNEPFFGAGYPGFSAEEAANRTSIGAIDNGYLSITVDMGLFGLLAAVIPIGVALAAIGRCLRYAVAPRYELAMALGVVGMAIVTAFYDSFYWAQIDLLLGAFGGALSVRISQIGRRRQAEVAPPAPPPAHPAPAPAL
jgi:O-antigen ligase